MAKTKTKPKRSAADRCGTQVSAESTLKFGPEESSLASALKDTDKQYANDVSVARGTRAAVEEAAKTAKPKLAADFKTSLGTVDQTKATLAADLAKLPSAGALAGASARDAEGTRRRLSEALAASKAETDTRAREAVSGEAFAVANAGSRRADAREKITDRQRALAQEKGAFAQGRSGELVEAGRDRSVTRRGQDKTETTAAANRRTDNANTDAAREETHRHNVKQEEIDAAKEKDKDKTKPASAKDTQKFKTALTRAQAQVNRVKSEVSDKDRKAGKTARDRSQTAGIVVNGRAGQKIENDKDGNALPTPVVIPDVKATDELVTSVALDIAYDGHVSSKNLALLHKQGLSVKDLGLPTSGRSGTKGATKQPIVPRPRKPARGTTNPLTGTTLGGLPG